MFVAIGGITLNGNRGALRFFWHAFKTLRVAKASEGCIHAAIFRQDGVFFALSVWDNKQAMQAYGRSSSHVDAVRRTRHIVRSAVNHHYEANSLPTRDEAVATWKAGGHQS